MDRCLKDKAHFIIAQTIWNNKNGKAVFAEQVFDRCQRKFQDEINRELYKLIEEGGGGSAGKDGKTPVLKAGEITSLPYGSEPTFKLVYEGNNHEGNPVYRMDLRIPQGKPGEDGDDGDDGISPTLRLTEQGIEFLKGGNFSNFTGKFDFSYISFVKNVSNISQFQIQAYGQEHSVETLIAILDGLIDTTASPKSQGVGNTYNLRKLQATEAGLAAIARAEAKGWTITSNV